MWMNNNHIVKYYTRSWYDKGGNFMYFSKFAKKVLAVAVAVAVTASSVVATPSTKKADAASYKAYLCLQTSAWRCKVFKQTSEHDKQIVKKQCKV